MGRVRRESAVEEAEEEIVVVLMVLEDLIEEIAMSSMSKLKGERILRFLNT